MKKSKGFNKGYKKKTAAEKKQEVDNLLKKLDEGVKTSS
ncbi:hypothetical protein J2S17_003125 [Cytobacillus purgationiresistens]|uniref:Uncharacterized protein n=1 Tax=Cytobacillus purgationiresistens TaxID=863449 RepID=A0ABU0AKD9_9BACI|nr:hypothetical protein [Cytobacillus purgationiresistens]